MYSIIEAKQRAQAVIEWLRENQDCTEFELFYKIVNAVMPNYTTTQVAEILNTDRRNVQNYAKRHGLPKFGREYIITETDILFIMRRPLITSKGTNMPECVSCLKPFTPNLDEQICDDCVNEAYSHKPELYVKIKLVGYRSYIQPMNQFGLAMDGEFDGAEAGTKWEIELIEMSKAEYDALPEFEGH